LPAPRICLHPGQKPTGLQRILVGNGEGDPARLAHGLQGQGPVTEIDGERMETYIDWMKSCYYVTVAGLPASVACGFTPEGLPVGAQIVGRYRDDLGVLQLAHAFEEATRHGERRPPLAG